MEFIVRNEYEGLREYATDTQLKYLDILASIPDDHGKWAAVARETGRDPRGIRRSMKRLAAQAARQGHSPGHDMNHTVPDGFHVKGTSTLYKDGEPALQWVKTNIDHDRQKELFIEGLEAAAADLPRLLPVDGPGHTIDALHNVYTLTDSHVGMLSWGRETGEDWDLYIAEDVLVGCFEQMVSHSPDATSCTVNQLGDFVHFDGLDAVTPTSGHQLDADGRFQKVAEVVVTILRRVIDIALAKHDKVHVVMAEGNHDMASSVWLRVIFDALYENEPRVTVDKSPLPYYVYQHGKTMLAFHHGHLKKMAGLPLLFAARYPEMWGNTKHRVCHVGHLHHKDIKESPGMTVMQHRTLATADAYSARNGFISERSVTTFTYHKEHGEVASNTITPEMLK